MTNTKKLKGKLAENGETIQTLAKKLNMSAPTLSYKINNKSEFSATELKSLLEILNIEDSDIRKIFFADNVAI